jgi:nitroimidazol reductase NimA-like FMN-containing flavoprotein (pyridoxamine 5'-phosphate oxidase superfamily)
MRDHQLDREATELLLQEVPTGFLASISPDGRPYVTPVHFVFIEGKIYVHGNPKGTKIDNLKRDPRVSFTVVADGGIIHGDEACETNTRFRSAIIQGEARMLSEPARALIVLDAFVQKYTPQHFGRELPPGKVKATGIIEVDILSATGKYYS